MEPWFQPRSAHINFTHFFYTQITHPNQRSVLPPIYGRRTLPVLQDLFWHLTSPSSLYPACLISSSPPAFRHTQDFPVVKPINKPTPQWFFPMTVFIQLSSLLPHHCSHEVPCSKATTHLLAIKSKAYFSVLDCWRIFNDSQCPLNFESDFFLASTSVISNISAVRDSLWPPTLFPGDLNNPNYQ